MLFAPPGFCKSPLEVCRKSGSPEDFSPSRWSLKGKNSFFGELLKVNSYRLTWIWVLISVLTQKHQTTKAGVSWALGPSAESTSTCCSELVARLMRSKSVGRWCKVWQIRIAGQQFLVFFVFVLFSSTLILFGRCRLLFLKHPFGEWPFPRFDGT